MKIVYRGVKKPQYPWAEIDYHCVKCDSVIRLEDEDWQIVDDYGEDQRDGKWVDATCPVCEHSRKLSDCKSLVKGTCKT